MTIKSLITRHLILALGCGVLLSAQAAEVINAGSNRSRWVVSQEAVAWKPGDYACVLQEKTVSGCGSITESHGDTATLKLNFMVRDSYISQGDVVARAEPPASRGPASITLYGTSQSLTDPKSYSNLQFSTELLGVGLLYSAGMSFRQTPDFALNAGLTFLPLASSSLATTYIAMPLSVSYLMGKRNHKFELTGGATASLAIVSSSFNGATITTFGLGVVPFAGVGYRYWPWEGGIHFRVMLYGMLSLNGAFAVWPGIGFGYAL